MIKPLLLAAVGADTFALALPAHADDNDASFVQTLGSMGITYSGGYSRAVKMGHAICQAMDANDQSVVTTGEVVAAKEGVSDTAAGFTAGAAIMAFCPWDKGRLWQ